MGNKRDRKRIQRLRGGIREMQCTRTLDGYPYLAVLRPQHWRDKPPLHDEIIDVVRGWGPCRVRTDKRIIQQRTRIYFTNEASLLMLRVAFPDHVWKMFRCVNIGNGE